jgi:replication factor C small subunit
MSDEQLGLLSERLRPRTLSDLTLSGTVVGKLQRMLEKKTPMNMIFHGPAGIGKTSAGQIFLSGWETHDKLTINGANETGINHVRDVVTGFASSPFRTEDLRLCFIDEADYLSPNAQASLRVLIERSSTQCRFIFALNELGKLSPALRSRLFAVDFSVRQANAAESKLRFQSWYANRLAELGVSFDRKRLDDIVTLYCPDFRRIANALEFEFST